MWACICVGTLCHDMYGQKIGQIVGISSFLPPCGSQGSDSEVRLGATHLYLLKYLVGPWLLILKHKMVKLLIQRGAQSNQFLGSS